MYYIYMIRCCDNSVYTGITTDVNRRIKEHCGKGGKGAKYTLTHVPKKLECVWRTATRQDASKLEYRIKSLKKSCKEELIKNPLSFEGMLSDKLEIDKYELCKDIFKITFD